MLKERVREERAKEIGNYIVVYHSTIRQAAEKFGVSKSTVHKDVNLRLPKVDRKLYNKVRKVLDYNTSQRSIRGGIATMEKYKK